MTSSPSPPKSSWRGLLALCRPRLLPSALCDVGAGFALGGGRILDFSFSLLLTLLGSLCLYTLGMILNDFAGQREDRILGKKNPLVSGEAKAREALALGLGLLLLGNLALGFAGISPLLSGILSLGIVLYDFGSAGTLPPRPFWAAISPLLLGACRGLNLSLGFLLLHPSGWGAWPIPFLAFSMYGVYTALVVLHGRLEDSRRNPQGLSRALGVIALFLLASPTLFLAFPWAGIALLPSVTSVLRETDTSTRTGVLLQGFSRFGFIMSLGAGSFGLAGLCAIPAWILPLLVRRRWT